MFFFFAIEGFEGYLGVNDRVESQILGHFIVGLPRRNADADVTDPVSNDNCNICINIIAK